MPQKTKASRRTPEVVERSESDSAYFLKIVLYIVVGSFWLKFNEPIVIDMIQLGGSSLQINGLPVGLIIGLLFASHDHFQIDRKIEYAILLLTAIVTFFLPAGILL